MKTITLDATIREITGKKVKKIRQEHLIPATVFGKGIKSSSLSVPEKEFIKVFKEAGETGLIELKYGKDTQHVLIADVQKHPVSHQILHVQFHAVSLTEKIKANVPLELVGESPAVANNIGLLLQPIDEVEVEALPTDLPEQIAINVSSLSEVDQQITVGELPVPKGVEILTDKEEIVVKVAPLVSEEAKKEAEEEAAKEAAEKAAEVPPEGEKPEEVKSEEAPKEEKKE